MDGLSTANILNVADPGFFFTPSGFAGHVSGLTDVTIEGGSTDFGFVQIGDFGVGQGLLTALERVTFNASHELDAILDTGALSGTETLDVTLNGVDSFLFLDVTTGTTGYGEIDVHSDTGENFLGIDTGFDTVATLVADGDQNLELYGDVLDVANLELFNGTAATGDLFLDFFFGVGDVTALGGSGDDELIFWTDGAVAASGNDGDDILTWWTDFGDPTSFTAEDSADGGEGDNLLRLEAYNGALLGAGVGPNIVNIETIQHITFTGIDGNIDVDMANAGSATTLDLAGDYANDFDVTVTNLASTDTVVYSGTNLGDTLGDFLTLVTASPVGIINLTMAASPGSPDDGGVHTIFDLNITQGSLLNIVSTGEADLNFIGTGDFVANVDDVSITGDVDLSWGSVIAYGHLDLSDFRSAAERLRCKLGFS